MKLWSQNMIKWLEPKRSPHYTKGFAASKEGKPPEANPYARYSAKRKEWAEGWKAYKDRTP